MYSLHLFSYHSQTIFTHSVHILLTNIHIKIRYLKLLLTKLYTNEKSSPINLCYIQIDTISNTITQAIFVIDACIMERQEVSIHATRYHHSLLHSSNMKNASIVQGRLYIKCSCENRLADPGMFRSKAISQKSNGTQDCISEGTYSNIIQFIEICPQLSPL